jgi:hypothetical protein
MNQKAIVIADNDLLAGDCDFAGQQILLAPDRLYLP